jgi:very-short-patch-repair endonuclease
MPGEIKEVLRYLRKNQTPSENILWQVLRNRKLDGIKFVRQFPIIFEYQGRKRFFVADFYCHEAKLVIELDGEIHEKQVAYDENRTFVINQLGIKVLRIKNEELKDITQVKTKIRVWITKALENQITQSKNAGGE